MSGEKTEQPTQHRLQERRKEGQIPQRKNIVEAALLISAVLILVGFSGPLSAALLNLSTVVFSGVDRNFEAVKATSFIAAMDVVSLMAAICILISMFTLLTGLLLNKFNFSVKPLTPNINKLNPASQIKNIFSKHTIYNFIRMIIIFSSILIIFISVVWGSLDDSINASYCGEMCLYPLFISRIKIVVTTILLVLLLMAATDYRIQTRLFASQNKMTKEEVKREHKEQEGDPKIKFGRRSIAMEDAALPMPSEATHVVHSDQVLVALIFYPSAQLPPYVVFKAKGAKVPALCRKFRALKIPIVSLPSVALDFYRMAPPGQYLPPRSAPGMEKIMGMITPKA